LEEPVLNPVLNPYAPGAGTRPPALVGRDALLDASDLKLQRAVAGLAENPMMLVGLRGVGKTVLLNAFVDVAEARGLPVARGEITDTDGFPAMVARMARSTLYALSLGERVRGRTARALGVVKAFSLKIPGAVEVDVELDPVRGRADSGDLAADLTDLFDELGRASREHDKAVVLALDEAQELGRVELGALLSALHHVAQDRLPVVCVCAGLPQLQGRAGEAKSYAERLVEFVTVDSLEEADAAAALTIPAADFDVSFSSEAIERIVTQTGGYPYYLQAYGKHVWNTARDMPVSDSDVERATPLVLAALDEGFFRTRLDRVPETERRYLRAMAGLGPGPHRSGDIAAAMDRKASQVSKVRDSLISKGLLYSPRYGWTAFTVPRFDEFLLRIFPPEAV